MKTIITDGKGNLDLIELPKPELGDYDCLVKTKSCLFCNSTDRHIMESSFFGMTYPVALGHESIGNVIELGSKVKNFSVNDLVIRPLGVMPGEPAGEVGSGWGGFSEYGRIRDWQAMIADGEIKKEEVPNYIRLMMKVPDSIRWEDAMMISCQKEIYSAAKCVPDPEGKKILVAGAGAAGIMFGEFLTLRGAEVCITARRQEQLNFASNNTKVKDAILLNDLTEKYDLLLDATGHIATAKSLMENNIKEDGTFYSYALYEEMSQDGFNNSLIKYNYTRVGPDEFSCHDEVCEIIKKKEIDCTPYINFKFKAEEYNEAWQTVADKKSVKTAVLF
jgi:L-iditol 2-dehydrogenase